MSDSPGSARTELELDQQGFSQYLLYSRSEIVFVLRQVLQKKCMITVYFDAGRSFFLTSLVAISDDGNWLYFDLPADPSITKKAGSAGKLMMTTMLERVKVQFSLNGLQEVASSTRATLAGHLPETLLRLQRREHYRLSTPIANPIRCHLTVPATDSTPACEIDANVLDISGGGLGMAIPDAQALLFPVGTSFSNCRIDLPEEGVVSAGLCVRNGFGVTTKTGSHHWRVGFEYVDLSGHNLTIVQRYITRTERERKAREAGLG